VLGVRLPAMGTGPGSEKLGVCPRPRYLLAPFMLRLISKPVCDGASSGLGVLGVCYLFRRSWRRRKTALETDGVFREHKRSSGLVCNFPLLRGLLCKMLWTAVLLCLSGRCLYGSRSVLFYYGIIQVLCYQKKLERHDANIFLVLLMPCDVHHLHLPNQLANAAVTTEQRASEHWH